MILSSPFESNRIFGFSVDGVFGSTWDPTTKTMSRREKIELKVIAKTESLSITGMSQTVSLMRR